MTVTDSDGLSSSDTIFLQPEKSTVTLNSVPSGLTVLLDGVEKTTPFIFDELINFQFELEAPNQCANDNSYTFSSWSDAGAQTHQISVPETTTQYTVNFDEFEGCIICERAIDLDGTGDQLVLENNAVLTNDFTIEFWANLDENMGSADQPLGDGLSNGADFAHNINFSQGKARLYTKVTNSDQIASTIVAQPNAWNHYAFVREGSTMKIYVNGTLNKSNAVVGGWNDDFIVAKLGTTINDDIWFFDGELDEIRLWNIARSDSEIAQFYNKSIEPSSLGLEAYWSFNEQDDTQVISDLTGNGHDAVLGLNMTIEPEDPQIVFSNLIENDCAFNFVYNNGWVPSDPNGISKLSNSIIIENGNITISDDTFCNEVSVKPGTSVTINSGASLITDSGMTLESSSESYSSLILDGSVVGDVFYKRHVNNAAEPSAPTGNNDLISPPVTGQSFGDFRLSNPNIMSGTIGGSPAFLFGPFNNLTNAYINYTTADDAAILNAGYGYRTGSTDGSTFTFTGNVESSTVNVPVTTGGASNWNLIGNPYPSYLKAIDFLNNIINSGLIDENSVGIYGYNGEETNKWTIVNLATVDLNPLISPGQGFFVNALANGNINFTPAMRTIGNEDDFISGRNAEDLIFLKLKVNSNTDSYTTDFYFNDNASLGLDVGYDASVWNNNPSSFSIYSHLVQGDAGIPMAIQTLNSTDISNVIIPIGLNASADSNITFSIEETTIPQSIDVYLEDNAENTFTLLNSSNYQISTITDLNGTGRFYLHFSESSLNNEVIELNKLQVYANHEQQTIDIKGTLTEKTKLNIYDIHGRSLIHLDLMTNVSSQHIDVSKISVGIYVVELTNSQGKRTKKVIIR